MKQYTIKVCIYFDAENPYGNTEQVIANHIELINTVLRNNKLDCMPQIGPDYDLIEIEDK